MPVSTTEWMPSLIIAELPVMNPAMNLMTAIAMLPRIAAITAFLDSAAMAGSLQDSGEKPGLHPTHKTLVSGYECTRGFLKGVPRCLAAPSTSVANAATPSARRREQPATRGSLMCPACGSIDLNLTTVQRAPTAVWTSREAAPSAERAGERTETAF